MERYSEYKPSDVEWIGEIPSHWEVIRIGYLSKLITGFPWKSELFDWDSGMRIVRGENVSEGFLRWGERSRYWKEHVDKDSVFFLNKDDIVIPMDGSKVGKNYVLIKENDLPLLLHQRMCRVRPNKELVSERYLVYYIGSEMFRYYIDKSKTDPMVPHITQKDVFDFKFSVPPLPEQEEIVRYLDTKTQEIDQLVSITQKKIDLLKERRTSTINEVVTKGLNPNVELKDSGVEWIGEIPSHWEVKRLKYVSDENQESLSNSTDPNYRLKYLEISDVSDGVISEPTEYVFSESPSRCRRIVQKGDVIISTVRTYLRSIGIIEEEVEDLICSTGFSVLTPRKGIVSKYLFQLFRTEWFISRIISQSVGVSYPSIQSEKLMENYVLVPPLPEQEEIVRYLDTKTQEIDQLVSIEENRINTLKEYRQSLISEVVTGKVKVTSTEPIHEEG
jgi:type I restriction enzyme S subunit